jgi:hypothetical protein
MSPYFCNPCAVIVDTVTKEFTKGVDDWLVIYMGVNSYAASLSGLIYMFG